MLIPPLPEHESERLKALNALCILDTPPEERLDRLTRLAQHLFDVPIAVITLIDSDRQWFKSVQGLPVRQTSRNVSFCGHTILSDDAMVIPNALLDQRFSDNPLVTGEPHIRFYAGAPLHSVEGYRVGVLCIIDAKPREFSEKQIQALRDLADCVEHEVQATVLLHASNNLRQAILDAADFTIISTDVDGVIRTFSRGAQRMLGYSEEEVVGKVTPAIIHDPQEVVARAAVLSQELGEEIEPGFNVFVAKAKRGDIEAIEWTYIRKDGSRFPVLLSITSIRDQQNNIIGFLGIGSDISERKKADQAKNEFISTVSHELRTPLTSIRGALGLVMGKFADNLAPKALSLLDTANRNAERLTLLINDILDLEKIESGKLEFTFQALDIIALAQQAIAANEGYAERHRVSLQLNTQEKQLLVNGDEHRLMQVFANLLSNAVKYSPPDGCVILHVQRQGKKVRLAVEDHGRGIPEEFRPCIFGRFAQLDSTDSREKGGTGLGLSITKAIIQRHDSSIDYHSIMGHGTRFFFDLPLLEMVCVSECSSPDATILICEDDTDNAQILKMMLEKEGLSCHVATTASATRQALLNHQYALLILDLMLPDGNGMDLLDAVPAACKIIVLTADKPALEKRNERIAAILTKTQVSDTALIQTIQQVMQTHQD